MRDTLIVGSILAAPIIFSEPAIAVLFGLGIEPTLISDGASGRLGYPNVGAMGRRTFDDAVSVLRHPPGAVRPGVAAGPINGQAALDVSLQIGANSTRRIGVDYAQRQFVVFDEHAMGMFHGHVRSWDQLTQQMQAVLRRAGMVDRRGNIVTGN